jgi:uncharacterized RDD family membrane protein YckC
MARLIDGAVLAVITTVVLAVALTLTASSRDRDGQGTPSSAQGDGAGTALDPGSIEWGPTAMSWRGIVAILGAAGIIVVYDVGSTLALGATPGKRILRLRVVNAAERTAAGTGRMAARTALLAMPVAFAVLMAWTSMFYAWTGNAIVIAMFAWIRRDGAQTLYDRWAGTQVISLREEQ